MDLAKLAGVLQVMAAQQGQEAEHFLPLRKTEIGVAMSGAVVETSVMQYFNDRGWRRAWRKSGLTRKFVFWKSVIAYINGTGDTTELRESKLLSAQISDELAYEGFLWDLFGEMQNPVWIERATKMLEKNKWVRDDIYYYLENFPASEDELLPKVTTRLEKMRAEQAQKTPSKWFFQYEISYAQNWLEHRWMRKVTATTK